MPLQFDRDDPPGLGQGRHNLSHSVDRHIGTVKQNQRFSGAVDLVIHLETVHGSVAARP
jgi:hypothetical protein